jgi:hypothetical protein
MVCFAPKLTEQGRFAVKRKRFSVEQIAAMLVLIR